MSFPKRKMPDDFPLHAAVETNYQLRKRYGCRHELIREWRLFTGVPSQFANPASRRKPDIPDWFASLAGTMSDENLARLKRRSPSTIRNWRYRLGIPTYVGNDTIPQSLALVCRTMTRSELAVRYHRTVETIDSWLKFKKLSAKLARRGAPGSTNHRFRAKAPALNHDHGLAGRAADYLRRFGEVIRCDVNGNPLPDGFFWRRGGRFVLTDEEIIQRAERLGWRADAWRVVA